MPSPALSLLVYYGHFLLYCCPAWPPGTLGVPGYGLALLAQNPVPGHDHSSVVTALTSV